MAFWNLYENDDFVSENDKHYRLRIDVTGRRLIY